MNNYVAAGAHAVEAPWPDALYDGGTEGMESPRLFADGKGQVCVTYVGGPDLSHLRVALQCSTDGGKTFGAPVDVELEGGGMSLHHPVGIFGADGITIAHWSEKQGERTIRIAKSADGTSFAAPIVPPSYRIPDATVIGEPGHPAIAWDGGTLWLSYLVGDGLGKTRLIVDKSCDGGATWSGAQLLNGPEPSISVDYQWPGLLVEGGAPRVYAPVHASGADDDPYDVIRLVP